MRRFKIQVVIVLISIFVLTAGPVGFASGEADAAQGAGLTAHLKAIAADHKGKVAVFAENLKTGETASVDADVPVPTASVIKLTILYEALEQVRAGKARLEETVVLRKEDQVAGSGVLAFLDAPLNLTLRDVLTLMIVQSDNTATNLAIDRLGLKNIDDRIASIGLKDTYLYKKVYKPAEGVMPADQKQFGLGKTTAREMAAVMTRFYRCDLGKPAMAGDLELCTAAMGMLRNQSDRDGLPRYLEVLDTSEDGSAIGNKTGAVNAVRSDVALVASKRGMIVISAFTYENENQSWTSDNAGLITLAKVGKAVVQAWSPDGLDAGAYHPEKH